MEVIPFYYEEFLVPSNLSTTIEDFQKSFFEFKANKIPSNKIGIFFYHFFVFLSMLFIKEQYPTNKVFLSFNEEDISNYIELAYGMYMVGCNLKVPQEFLKNYIYNISFIYNNNHLFKTNISNILDFCKNLSVKTYQDLLDNEFSLIQLADHLIQLDINQNLYITSINLKFYMSDGIKNKIKDFLLDTTDNSILIIPSIITIPEFSHIGFFYISYNNVSYYEPHGVCYNKVLDESHKLIYSEMEKYIKFLNITYMKDITIYKIESTCAEKGIQAIECEMSPTNAKFGYCSAWSRLIIQEIFKIAGRVKTNINLPKYIENKILDEINDKWKSPREYISTYSIDIFDKIVDSGYFKNFFIIAKENFENRMRE